MTSRSARWHLPEVQIGWIPPWGLETLTNRVGLARARQLVWGAQPFMGEEAVRLGVADHVVDDGEALTRALAVEYAPFNIRVNALAPGFVETNLTSRVLRNPMIAKALIDQTPLRRFGSTEEIARAALFFASDDSSFVTGAELAVDGGMAAGL